MRTTRSPWWSLPKSLARVADALKKGGISNDDPRGTKRPAHHRGVVFCSQKLRNWWGSVSNAYSFFKAAGYPQFR